MNHFENRERLRPFRELADAAVDVAEADQGDEEDGSAEDGDPEDGRGEVVQDQILRL